MLKRSVASALVLTAALLVLTLAGGAVGAGGGGGNGLSKQDREALAQAKVNGKSSVGVLIASKPGANPTVASGVQSLGGNIRYREDSIDYVRAIVAIDKVDAVARLDGVQAVSLDRLIPIDDPAPEAGGSDAVPTPPGPGTPAENSQLPTRDIGAPQFVAAHPTYDGRGVVIGILDTGIDVLTPELQTAKTLDGTPTRKIIDWKNFNDPVSGLDPSWVNMQTQVTVTGGSFTSDGVTYTGVPADGSYRFGIFDETAINPGSEYGIGCGADLNRNGICGEKFVVLWNTSSNTVWVDSNADRSFTGEQAMQDYNVNYDIGIFGTDNPGTPLRETVPFTIQTDGKDKFVNIGVVGAEHGTHVAGIAAGKHFFGGAMNGAAPEAQIVSIRVCVFGNSCTSAGLIEGMIYAEKQANVDVINMSIGGLPALNDGNNARAILYNRLIDQSKAQMFISAGNSGSGVNTVGDPSVATKVMSVGASVQKDTWFNNYGALAVKDDGLFVFTSRGPREDGGFKPNIVAPGAAISSIPAWEQNFPLIGPLPPGYDLLNGTSMAAPEATGGAALLISAAKQSGAQHQPDQLRQAINSSARYLPAYGAYEQGNGLMQVGAAWNVLRQNLKTVDITSKAPVHTVLSGFLATPGEGPGIYDREGWAPGQSGTRTITFTRNSGGSKPVTYNLSWVGNDGTFSGTPGSISLGQDTPVAVNVNVSPATNGVHSAILRLDDPSTAGIDYKTLNTVVAAAQFNVANNFSVSYNGTADRPDKAAFFFFVPANTPAFKVDVTNIVGRVRLTRFHPYGLPIEAPGFQTGGTISRTVAAPDAGVWEADIDVSRTSTVAQPTFTVTGSILGVALSPTSWTIDPATIGTPYTQAFTFTNGFGSFTGNAAGTTLGSKFASRPTIANHAQQTFQFTVPAGSSSFTARITNAADPSADLDLYVFNSAGNLVGSETDGDADETVTINNPAADTYTALVDAFAVPSGSTAYDYFDLFTNSGFGSVSVTDPAAVHPNGDVWTRTASVTPLSAPSAGRFLEGFVQVRSGSAVLGSAPVDLRNVGP